MRNYNENPIIITNYSVQYESHLIMLIALIGIPILTFDIYDIIMYDNAISPEIVIGLVSWIYLIYLIFWVYPKGMKDKKNFFKFTNESISFHYEYIAKNAENIDLVMDVNEIKSVSYCIVSELPDSYGRWHYLSAWKLYRQSSIGVHIGKVTLFLQYFITYMVFILPSKLKRLYTMKEPYALINKNLFIQFSNRNYFLVNIYSQDNLNDLTEYLKKYNITIVDKTYFIPHLQNQGWFVDKEEKWEEVLNLKGKNNG